MFKERQSYTYTIVDVVLSALLAFAGSSAAIILGLGLWYIAAS